MKIRCRYHEAWDRELDHGRTDFHPVHPAVRLIADQAKRRLFA